MNENSRPKHPDVLQESERICQLCEGIAVLAEGMETNPSCRAEWLQSCRERLELICHDLTFARFGLTTGGTR